MTAQLDQLVAGKYLLLTTFRKDGRAVATPVWFAEDGAELKVWTVTDSGKVKRIRRDSAVTITACDVRGKPHGDAIDARARLLDEAETLRVRSLISRRYGLFGWVIMLGSRLRRGSGHNIGIAITPAG